MTTATDRLDEIEARLAAATPRPWSADDEHGLIPGARPAWTVSQTSDGRYVRDVAYTADPRAQADADLIAHAPDDLAALVEMGRAVLALHRVKRRWLICDGESSVESIEKWRSWHHDDEDDASHDADAEPMDLCAECARVEATNRYEDGWGYDAAIWPCATVRRIEAALGEAP